MRVGVRSVCERWESRFERAERERERAERERARSERGLLGLSVISGQSLLGGDGWVGCEQGWNLGSLAFCRSLGRSELVRQMTAIHCQLPALVHRLTHSRAWVDERAVRRTIRLSGRAHGRARPHEEWNRSIGRPRFLSLARSQGQVSVAADQGVISRAQPAREGNESRLCPQKPPPAKSRPPAFNSSNEHIKKW